jgi:hypothetical protein
VQVYPIKHTLKALVTKRLKLHHDEPSSNFAFKFNLRRYTEEFLKGVDMVSCLAPAVLRAVAASCEALVGRCRLTLSNPL